MSNRTSDILTLPTLLITFTSFYHYTWCMRAHLEKYSSASSQDLHPPRHDALRSTRATRWARSCRARRGCRLRNSDAPSPANRGRLVAGERRRVREAQTGSRRSSRARRGRAGRRRAKQRATRRRRGHGRRARDEARAPRHALDRVRRARCVAAPQLRIPARRAVGVHEAVAVGVESAGAVAS